MCGYHFPGRARDKTWNFGAQAELNASWPGAAERAGVLGVQFRGGGLGGGGRSFVGQRRGEPAVAHPGITLCRPWFLLKDLSVLYSIADTGRKKP